MARELRTRLLFAVAIAPALSGCGPLGCLIGSAVSANETQRHGSLDPSKLVPGAEVEIDAKAPWGEGVRHVEGTYRRLEDDEIVVLTVAGESRVALCDIDKLTVKRDRSRELAIFGSVIDFITAPH